LKKAGVAKSRSSCFSIFNYECSLSHDLAAIVDVDTLVRLAVEHASLQANIYNIFYNFLILPGFSELTLHSQMKIKSLLF
jgi:hypothetical protein